MRLSLNDLKARAQVQRQNHLKTSPQVHSAMPASLSITHVDVTGTAVHFTAEKVSELILALSPEQRRMSQCLALGIQTPQEIWRHWERAPHHPDGWVLYRTYVNLWETTEADGSALAYATVSYGWKDRWALAHMTVLLDPTYQDFAVALDEFRHGEQVYTNHTNPEEPSAT